VLHEVVAVKDQMSDLVRDGEAAATIAIGCTLLNIFSDTEHQLFSGELGYAIFHEGVVGDETGSCNCDFTQTI
jgi:hypothetical protein